MTFGGAEGDRTPDLVIANDALSQLSYGPNGRYLGTATDRSQELHRLRRSEALRELSGPGYMLCDCNNRRRVMLELLSFISYLITLYTYIIIAGVVMSWLIAFGVINGHNPMVRSIWQGLNAVTEPLLGPIRRMLPNMGGIDISPIILLLACTFLQTVVPNIAKAVV
jgi:YggT family protein